MAEQSGGCFLLADSFGYLSADVFDELGVEADGGAVLFDGVLDEGNVDVRALAGAVLLVTAEEVRCTRRRGG